jgi:hypothetical protein
LSAILSPRSRALSRSPSGTRTSARRASSDVALETADVVLLEGGLRKLPHAFDVADQAMRSVKRGLGLVIVPNAFAIGLGALGLITPGVAAVGQQRLDGARRARGRRAAARSLDAS